MLILATSFTLILGGDVMLNGIKPSDAIWKGIRTTVSSADLAFANLEIPLTDAKLATPNKSAADVKARNQFILKADPLHIGPFSRSGFDMVSLGNNHAMDYRAKGLVQMQAALKKVKIDFTGAADTEQAAASPVIHTMKDGTKIALISAMAFMTTSALRKVTPATSKSAGVFGLDLGAKIDKNAKDKLKNWIGTARHKADFVVVAMHWGTEKKTIPNAYQVTLARTMIDCGADIIWGNHPHVLQGAEVYRGKPILYSCGNLISPLPASSGLFQLSFAKNKLVEAHLIPTTIGAGKVTEVKAKATKVKEFAGLCQALLKKFPNRNSKALISAQ